MRIASFLIIIVWLASCTVAKDRRALSRVITKPDLADRAYAELVKLHPIRVDSVIKIVEGEKVVTYDTVYQEGRSDTLLKLDTLYITKFVNRIITKDVLRIDTAYKTIVDSRLLDAANTRITVLQTKLEASEASDKKHTKGKWNWVYAFAGMSLLFLLLLFLFFKSKTSPIKYG